MSALRSNIDDPVEVPEPDPQIVDAFVEMLLEDTGALRPPTKAAHLLAVICMLHKQDQPFPGREPVAQHIGCGVSTVDAALSTRLAEGYISQVVETSAGNVARRNSVVRRTYYKPSKRLLDTFDKAASSVRVHKSRPPRRKDAKARNIPKSKGRSLQTHTKDM